MKAVLKNIIDFLEEESGVCPYVEIPPQALLSFLAIGKRNVKNPVPAISQRRPEGGHKQTPDENQRQNDKKNKGAKLSIPSPEEIKNSKSLEGLNAVISDCAACKLHSGRTTLVFGEGNPDAELMFIGEGPGRDEDMQGKPFVGRAGQLLTKMIEAMKFSRREVYIANIVKCRPPENRAPEGDEVEACLPFLMRQIELIKPKVIVLLGAIPAKSLLGVAGINQARGKWFDVMGIKTMPTYHPAYLLRQPAAKKYVWDDLKLVMAMLEK
jgi:DNA polymerase